MSLLELVLERMEEREPQSVELMSKHRHGRKNLYEYKYLMDDGSYWLLLKSYHTPVAVWDGTNEMLLKSPTYWSRTTTRHLSYWSNCVNARYLGTISDERLKEIYFEPEVLRDSYLSENALYASLEAKGVLNMVTDLLFAFLIVIGMLFLWEVLVTKFPEAFITNYDYTDNGADQEEE